jgi:hypothetical protein
MITSRPKNLGDADDMPGDILSRLEGCVSLFKRLEFSEEFESHAALRDTVRELDAVCESDGIVGVHYTRAEHDGLLTEGLVPRSGAERRAQFLQEYGNRFSAAQRERLVAGWHAYFDDAQNRIRDGRIWFNLTRVALSNGSADPLLSHFGGEVVYMPFSRDSEIKSILSGIGSPLLVECALQTDSVRTFCQHPWGRTWLSSYHRSVNPAAHQWDVDLYTERPVRPDEILNIELVDVD